MMAVDPEAQRRREECERKARRGEMDPRLEFVFQLLMDGTQLPRHQIMDHIFDGDMVIPCFDFIAIMLEFCKKKEFFAVVIVIKKKNSLTRFLISWHFQLDEINQLFLPNMRQKLMWFYQESDEPESTAPNDQPKPGPSRAAGTSSSSKTPQGKQGMRKDSVGPR